MDDIFLILGIVLLIAGALKRHMNWGKGLLVAGVIVICVGLLIGWPELVRGFQDGMSD